MLEHIFFKNLEKRLFILLFSLFIPVFLSDSAARADGFIIPETNRIIRPIIEVPNFSIKYHRVNIEINDQYAKTKVSQVFKNDTNMMLEGTYIFPIPEDASISNFSMYMGKQKVKGKIYSKEEARRIYEEIVQKRKDPALLEYFNDGFFKANVFPIPANGEAETELQYEQLTRANNQVYKYVYSLSTEKLSNKPLEDVTVNIRLKTGKPLKSIYSPTHELKITRINENEATVSYEAKDTKPNIDFIIYYTVSESDVGLNLLTFNDEEESKGYFLMMASPKYKVTNKDVVPKNVIFIIDTSGSMSGEKIEQAKDALKFCIKNLNKTDNFNIVTFSDSVENYQKSLISASDANIKKALKFSDTIEAAGGTNIDEALDTGLSFTKKGNRPSTILFLTDGQPTVGEQNTATILNNLRKYNSKAAKIFVFGVGFDVNTQFLDKIGTQNHGDSDYVRPEENIESTVSNLFSKVNQPVLADIKLDFSGVNISEIYPKELPDLFKGSQLVVMGRYTGGNSATISISGKVDGQNRVMKYPVSFNKAENTVYLPKLWATRKIGYLLDEIRLKGKNQELVDEVIKLSKKYGIITEFTSFLVQEDINISQPAEAFRGEVNKQLDDAQSADKGSWGISQSRNSKKLKTQAAQAPNTYLNEAGETVNLEKQVQSIGNKSFYQKKNEWVDSDFKEENIIKIKIFSPAYFELSRKIKEVNKYLSAGNTVSLNIKGQNIQIGEKGQDTLTSSNRKALGI
jgi:Ca-activated chloride channel family protein